MDNFLTVVVYLKINDDKENKITKQIFL
jgi:hypothetical protein